MRRDPCLHRGEPGRSGSTSRRERPSAQCSEVRPRATVIGWTRGTRRDRMSESTKKGSGWWGDWRFAPGEHRFWQVGPIQVWIERRRLEWLIVRRRGPDPLEDALEIASDRVLPEDGAPGLETDRIAAKEGEGLLSLMPRLADRVIVVRPASPFHVAEGAEIALFVSSPLWLSIGLAGEGEPIEFPAMRPRHTWLGSTTLTGEMAYAIKTSCRVDSEGLPIRPQRAITPLRIRNPGPGRLTLERVAVPVPILSLFAGANGRLWTQALKITRDSEESGIAEAEILSGPPEGVLADEPVSGPRRPTESRFVRIVDALF